MERIIAALPEGKLFDQIYEIISACAHEAGLNCARTGIDLADESVRLSNSDAIRGADLVLVHISHRSPTTFYQAGLAHALERPVIFVMSHGDDFPFSRSAHARIVYNGDLDLLRDELRERFKAPHPDSPRDTEPQKEAPTNGNDPKDAEEFHNLFGEILKKHNHVHGGEIHRETPTTFTLLNQDMDLPLVQDLSRKARELGYRIKLM